MAQELQDIRTPIKPIDLLYALGFAWVNLFNEQPKKESLVLLLAHNSLETGVGAPSCHNFNLTNIKSIDGDGRNYVFYKCNELVKLDMARQFVTNAFKDGGAAYISGVRSDGFAWVNFEPKSKYCRFRAFDTLEEGVIDYLMFIKNRYIKDPSVWQALIDGNPYKFCERLRANGFFTADLSVYAGSVTRLYNQFLTLEYDPDKLPILSDVQKENIQNLIGLTMNITSDDIVLDKSTDDQT